MKEPNMAKRRRRRSGRLAKVTVMELQAELQRRRGQLASLLPARDTIADDLARVEAEVEALGGTLDGTVGGGPGRRARRGPRGGGGRRRPHNALTLVDALKKLLAGRTMRVTEITPAVQKAGYRTASKTFPSIVRQSLVNSGKFKRVSRGQYTAK
jgi:hypothetical protein